MCDTGQGLIGDPILDQAWDAGLQIPSLTQDPHADGPISSNLTALPNPLGNELGCDVNFVAPGGMGL